MTTDGTLLFFFIESYGFKTTWELETISEYIYFFCMKVFCVECLCFAGCSALLN
jgi:hypothetical protein